MYSNESDITKNLSSLQFDAGIASFDRELLYLRKRSMAATLSLVAHATYFTAILKEVHSRVQKDVESEKKAHFKVGLIGCGRIGTNLVKSLLTFTNLSPDNIIVSTHRPNALLGDLGVKCFYDNVIAVKTTDLAFLTCLPSNFDDLVDEIKGQVNCLLYSFLAGISSGRIAHLLQCESVFKPKYCFSLQMFPNTIEFDFSKDVNESLATSNIADMYSPFYDKDTVVRVNEFCVYFFYYAALNICIDFSVSEDFGLRIVNRVMFRLDTNANIFNKNKSFKERKFILSKFQNGNIRNLDSVMSESIQNAFNLQYRAVFDTFTDWRLLT